MPRLPVRKNSKSKPVSRTLERLEPRLLLSAFSNADLAGTLTVAGMKEQGTVISDGNGNIVGGSEIKDDGSTDVPNGTYSLAENGTITIPDNNPKFGAMNSSKNVTAFSSQASNSLSVVISSASTNFSNADLKGTWYEFDNGDSGPPDNPPTNYSDNSGHALITFDGKGGLTYLHFEDETGKSDSGDRDLYRLKKRGDRRRDQWQWQSRSLQRRDEQLKGCCLHRPNRSSPGGGGQRHAHARAGAARRRVYQRRHDGQLDHRQRQRTRDPLV